MKPIRIAAALFSFVAAPAFAAATVLDFEHVPSFAPVAGYYDGIGFGGDMLGLSNDELGPYFSNAPSALGVITAVGGDATMNVAAGFSHSISFFYSSSALVTGAVNVYSGLNGSGSLLASFNLVGNAQSDGCTSSAFCRFDQLASSFAGIAHSISFGNAANAAVFDDIGLDIAAVPEASTSLMMALGLAGMVGFVGARRRG